GAAGLLADLGLFTVVGVHRVAERAHARRARIELDAGRALAAEALGSRVVLALGVVLGLRADLVAHRSSGLRGAVEPLAGDGLGEHRSPSGAIPRAVLVLVLLDLVEHLLERM